MPPNRSPIEEALLWYAGLLLLTLASGFFFADRLSIYEDDWVVVAIPINESWHWLADNLVNFWQHWPQGRPLGWSVLFGLSKIGYALGGLPGAYLVAAAMISVNALLIAALVKPAFGRNAALLAAAAFILAPADTSRLLLTNSFSLQFAIGAGLWGCWLYRRGRSVLGYLSACAALLCYENGFMIFIAAEPLRALGQRFSVKRFAVLLVSVAATLLAALTIRASLGEARAAGFVHDPTALLLASVSRTFMGAETSFSLFLQRPFGTALEEGSFMMIASALVLALFCAFVVRSNTAKAPTRADCWALLVAASLPLLASYSIQLNNEVTVRAGRITGGVHYVSSLTLAFLVGALVGATEKLGLLTRLGTKGAICVYLALCFVFAQELRRDFELSAVYQRTFWSELIRLCPDATDGTVIMVTTDELPEGQYVSSHSWSVEEGWKALVERPFHERHLYDVTRGRAPAVFLVPPDWAAHTVKRDADLSYPHDSYLPPGFARGFIPLVNGNVIVVRPSWSGVYRRETGPFTTAAGVLQLRPADAAAPPKLTPIGAALLRGTSPCP